MEDLNKFKSLNETLKLQAMGYKYPPLPPRRCDWCLQETVDTNFPSSYVVRTYGLFHVDCFIKRMDFKKKR